MKLSLILSLFVLLCTSASAQEVIDCKKLLDTEPYFVQHKSSEKDSLLKRDIIILKQCGNFEPIDSVF